MKTNLAALSLGLALTAALAIGCASTSPTSSPSPAASDDPNYDPSKCGEVKPGVITSVNTMCVIMPQDPVDPALTAEWNGQKVGFCCKGCMPRWNKMDDAQKGAALAKAMGK